MAKKAFILGINTLGLKYSEKDADLMVSCLKHYGYEIFLPKGKTKRSILEKFDKMIDSSSKTDTVIFYFSGHGLASRGKLNLVINDDLFKNQSRIGINEITTALEQCKAINKAIILDCCHADITYAEWNPETSESYRLLTASERLERTKELDELKASFLSYQFHKALTDAAIEIADKDNKIYINELYQFLKKSAYEHNEKPNYTPVPIPNLLGNLKSNFEICTIPNLLQKKELPKIIPEKPYNKKLVNKLIKESRQNYAEGKIPQALNKIQKAYDKAPYNSEVIERYATILFRRLELDKISKMIKNYEDAGKEKDDNILIVKGELYRREKNYKQAVKILKQIEDRKKYNVEYLTGVSYLFLYGQDGKTVHLLSALRHLREANEYYPKYWYIKLTLAFACKLCKNRDEQIEKEAIDLLNNKIERHPDKVSAKLYRLFYFALIDDFEKFTEMANMDNIPESKKYELPIDFIDSTQDRLDLLFKKDKQKKEKYLSAFIKWGTYFS